MWGKAGRLQTTELPGMNDPDRLVADLLHHRTQHLADGEGIAPPIVGASIYRLSGDPHGRYVYGRYANPTVDAAEAALAVLEQAEAVCFPSGMAACSAVLHAVLKAGDTALLPADGYFAVRNVADRFLGAFGVKLRLVPTARMDTADVAGCRIVWMETPSNPGLDLCDIAAVAARAHAAGALVVVDNTTMTPLGQRPLDLGADVVVSADTKAVSGHSDLLAGHVATRDPALAGAIRDWRKFVGAFPGPHDAYLLHRGLETLELRFARMNATSLALAHAIEGHPKVLSVRHPGLPSHPMHALATRQMRCAGSMLGITLADRETAERFIAGCRYVVPGTSFGGTHSSAECRIRWGDAVAPGYVRFSVGCEPTAALVEDVTRALEAA
jgi:cystathionine gamma-lyase